MAKKKGDAIKGGFVPLVWEVLNSRAYKTLPHASAKALPYFLGKIKTTFNDPEKYEMEFSFSYSEAHKLGFASSTFSKVIQALVSFGFIDPVDKGGLRGDCKSLNIFRLSQRWKDYGTPTFKQLNWKCFIPRPRSRATSKKEMYSFKKGNKTVSEGQSISHSEAVEAF